MKKASKGDILQRIGGLGSVNMAPRPESSSLPETGSEGMSSAGSAAALDAAYAIVARLVLRYLEKRPERTGSVFELLDPLETNTDDLGPVIRWMAEKSYVDVLERRRNGDWLIRSTDLAKSLF